MATAQSVIDAITASLQKNNPATLADRAQTKVLGPYGSLLRHHCDPIPIGLVAVRIAHETNGNPRARSREDERGLLQMYPWLRQQCKLTDEQAYDPALNVACGCPDWVRRGETLRAQLPHLATIRGNDFWGLSNLTMSIGAGATKLLAQRTRGGFYTIWSFVRNQPHDFVQLPTSWWGSQSPELVAHRIAATAQWLAAADLVNGGASFVELIAVGVLGYAAYQLWKSRR